MSSGFPVDPEIPDDLVQLGIAFGLITPPPDQTLCTDWFGDPLRYLRTILTNPAQRDAAISLAEAAFGRAREELDLPTLPDDEEWIPIVNDEVNGDVTVGLFTVVEPSETSVKLSFGARVAFNQPDLGLALTLKLPLLRASDAIAAELLIGEPGNPLDITARVDILPIGLDAGPVGLAGACIQVRLPTAPGDEPALDFVLKGLRFPDQLPRDLTLTELADDLGPEMVNIVLALLRTQATIPAKVNHVLELLGLGGAGSAIPALPVDALIAQGQAALAGWFRQIAAEAGTLRTWFEALAGLFGVAQVNGAGTPDDPLRIALAAASWSPELLLSARPDPASGAPVLRAGARFELSGPSSPLPANSVGRARANIDFFTITLAAAPVIDALPDLNVLVELDSSGADPFLDVTLPTGQRVRLRTLRLGLALDEARRPVPLIEARDVVIGSDNYPLLDLSSAGTVQDAVANALDDVVGELLNLLGITSSDEGRAIASLAGFTRPAGVGAGDLWPVLVELPAFFANPLGAIGCYHQRVLEQPNAWTAVAGELAVLLRAGGIAAPAISGSGTETDPWMATLFDNSTSADTVRGAVSMHLFTVPGTDGDTHLRASIETRPHLDPINGTALAIVYRSDILDAGFAPAAQCPRMPNFTWAPRQRIGIELTGGIDLQAEVVRLRADSMSFELVWTPDKGFTPAVSIVNARLTGRGPEIVLPDFSLTWLDGVDLGTLPWPAFEALFGDWFNGDEASWWPRLGGLLAWLPSAGDINLRLPALPGFSLNLPAGAFPKLSLQDLLIDPTLAFRNWFAGLFAGGGDFPDFSLPGMGWLASLFSGDGTSFDGINLDPQFTGNGLYVDPWAIRLNSNPATPELLLWLDPDGPNLAGLLPLVQELLPDSLTGPLDGGGGSLPSLDELVRLLQRAASLVAALRDQLGDLTDLSTALEALRARIIDGDGLVLAADQTSPGFATVDLAPAVHLIAPGQIDDTILPAGLPPAAQRVFVSAALPGVANWPAQETAGANLIDLSRAGLRPEAFDLSGVGATGPWFVLLPTRADAAVFPDPTLDAGDTGTSDTATPLIRGIDGQTQRLRFALEHIRTLAGADLAVIAHSIAGQVAHRVAGAGGVSHLVTIGTPHTGATFEFLDDPEIGAAVRTLQNLRRMLDDAIAGAADVDALDKVIKTIGSALDEYVPDENGLQTYRAFPVADFTALTVDPLPASVTATAIVTRIVPDEFDRAMAAFVRRVLEAAIAKLSGAAPGDGAITHLGIGLRTRLATSGDVAGAVATDTALRLDLHQFALDAATDQTRPIPRLSWHTRITRRGGWLVGTPQPGHISGTPRDPRVRAIDFHVEADFLSDSAISARVVLHDAAIFGLHRDHWDIDLPAAAGDDLPLPPEIEALFGEIARNLSPLPGGGAVANLLRLAEALQIVRVDAEANVEFIGDGLRRFLHDAGAELSARLAAASPDRAAVIAALRRLVDFPETPVGQDRIEFPVGGIFELVADFSDGFSLKVETAEEGLKLEDALTLNAAFTIDTAGRLQTAVGARLHGLAGPGGAPGVDIVTDTAASEPFRAELVFDGNTLGPLPERINVFPVVDTSGVREWLRYYLPGELFRLGFEVLRNTLAAGGSTRLDALLVATGLLRADDPRDRLRNFAGLLAAPADWFSHSSVLGRIPPLPGALPEVEPAIVLDLVDGLRDMLELNGERGHLPLPFGGELVGSVVTNGVSLALNVTRQAAGDPVERSGNFIVSLGPGLQPSFSIGSSVQLNTLPGLEYLALDLAVDAATATTPSLRARLKQAGQNEIVLVLAPTPSGFDALTDIAAAAATQYVLPLVLNAATTIGNNIGTAIGSLGDALGVRPGGQFDASALRAFAADPAGQLRARLQADATALLTALSDIATPLLPTGLVSVTPGAIPAIVIQAIAEISVELKVAAADDIQFCIDVKGVQPVAGIAIDARLCFTPAGVRSMQALVEVIDPALLDVGPVQFLPFVAVYTGAAAGSNSERFEFGLWLDPAPPALGRDGLVLKFEFGGGAAFVCRRGETDDGPEQCAVQIARRFIFPLLIEAVVAQNQLQTWLQKTVGGTTTKIADLLKQIELLDTGPGGIPPYHLNPNGVLLNLIDGVTDQLLNRLLFLGARVTTTLDGTLPLGPFRVSMAMAKRKGRKVFGVNIDVEGEFDLISGDVRLFLETNDNWIDAVFEADPGITVLFVSLPEALTVDDSTPDFNALDVRIDPWIRVRGLGFGIAGGQGGKLIDLAASVKGIKIGAAYDHSFVGGNDLLLGAGQITLQEFSIPIGRAAGGGNPVASKLLSQGSETTQSGDDEEAAVSISPQFVIQGAPAFGIRFRLEESDRPAWIAIQRLFGPIYIEQVGIDYTEEAHAGGTRTKDISALLDGSVQIAGLNVGVDDLKLTVPIATPHDVRTWSIDLAGLGIGYEGGGVTIAGGFIKSRPAGVPAGEGAPPVEYAGMLQVDVAGFGGITGIGAYGVFPVAIDSTDTYTSLFGFVSLLAPLGGPPPFFITGVGGGIGLNRSFTVPEIEEVPDFPLVQALNPSSGFASDPVRAMQSFGTSFPASRGTFWFAAGIRFTSFALVESIAVLSVEVSDELDISLLGISRMNLPSSEVAIAQIELALRARLSTREGILSIQAQLTDNSWILSRDCRLTGGFAFVVFFKTGQFVLSLGGYHPRFSKPSEFPDVPRLGFNWTIGDAITIKGEAYFALTSSCVMAGGALEASYNAGIAWASFGAGVNILVSWDPFYYSFEVYIRVSAGVKIRICFFGCVTIKLSFSIGAELLIEGPELRGVAKLDLDVITVTVRFGAKSVKDEEALPWPEFYRKYIVGGDANEPSLGMSIPAGMFVPDPGTQQDPPTGEADKPFRVLPEFTLETFTRTASNKLVVSNSNIASLSQGDPQLDLGPMIISGITSTHKVTISRDNGGDVSAELDLDPANGVIRGNVPDGAWTYVAREERTPKAGLQPALLGMRLSANLKIFGGDIEVPLDLIDKGRERPLPFHQEKRARRRSDIVTALADSVAYGAAQPRAANLIVAKASEGIAGIGAEARRVLFDDRVAPPRLTSLIEGMVEDVLPAVEVIDEPEVPAPPPHSAAVGTPKLMGVLRGQPEAVAALRPRTTVPKRARQRVVEQTPPSVDQVRDRWCEFLVVRLERVAPLAAQANKTVIARGHLPATQKAIGAREFRPGFLAGASDRQLAQTIERKIEVGVELAAGDTQIWKLPNARRDSLDARPVLKILGKQQVRVVCIDRAGRAISDDTATSMHLEIQKGTSTIALLGRGLAEADDQVQGYSGWHVGTSLRHVHASTYLAPRAVLNARSRGTRRERRLTTVGVVPAGRIAEEALFLETALPGDSHTLVIAFDLLQPVEVEEFAQLVTLGLSGADRIEAADGHAVPPTVIDRNGTLLALFAISAESTSQPVRVSISTAEEIRLHAVMATDASLETAAMQVSQFDLAELSAGFASGEPAKSTVSWRPAQKNGGNST